ncbi:MAG: TIGR04211 family SH3 domain-containing protein [Proteobacteria bacterium]|nr:TIGR04211 family SH3 domain-containing protein [Pseudomonadota bacterium]
MSKTGRTAVLLLVFGLAWVPLCLAVEAYTTEAVDIMVRAGKGTDYKIVAVTEGGRTLELLDRQADYSRVRLPDGREGWMLTRYVSLEKPASVRVDEAEAALEAARNRATELSEKNSRLAADNGELAGKLLAATQTADRAMEDLVALREQCADALATRQDLQRTRDEAEQDRLRAGEAENRLARLERSTGIYWFLSGAGVLIFGMLLGSINRKKRLRSSLLR